VHIYVHEPRPERFAGLVSEMKSTGVVTIPVGVSFFREAVHEIRLTSEWMHPILIAGVPGSIDLIKAFRRVGGRNPILLLEDARDSDRIRRGLEAGADQIMISPLRGREVLARLHVVMRRLHGHAGGAARIGDLVVSFDGSPPNLNGRTIPLGSLESRILQRLALSAGQPVRRSELYETLYGLSESKPFPRVIDRHVSHLRAKLSAGHPGGHLHVRTFPGHGYALSDTGDASHHDGHGKTSPETGTSDFLLEHIDEDQVKHENTKIFADQDS
jgi:two-component system, cell cycle response regulator CtrA